MAGGLKFARVGQVSRTFLKTWGPVRRGALWIVLIQMGITAKKIAGGLREKHKREIYETTKKEICRAV